MMPIYTDKRSGRLFVQFDFNKQTFKQYLPKGATSADAKKLETQMRHKVFFAANGMLPPESKTFEQFVNETYLPHVKKNTPASFEKADHICVAALPFFRGRDLRSIKAADIEAFKAYRMSLPTQYGRTRKPATIHRELCILSKIFTLAVKNDYCDYNPCRRVDLPTFDNTQNTVLKIEDQERFLNSFDKWQGKWARDICILVLNTGLRQNDVLSLSKFHVDLNESVIRLVQGKTGRRVEIPLNSTAKTILAERMAIKGSLLFPSPKTGQRAKSIRKALAGACERAEIPHLTIRDLRRTLATRLEEAGVDSVTIARLLGHSDLRMVGRYARSTDAMRNAVNCLENIGKPTRELTHGVRAIR